MEALVSGLERSLAATKEQGGRGTVPKPIGSIRFRWEFTSQSNQERLEARSTEQLIANGRERIIHSDGYSLAVRCFGQEVGTAQRSFRSGMPMDD